MLIKMHYKKIFDKVLKETENLLFPNYKFETEINIVDEKTIKYLNYEFRQIEKATDVLSFPFIEKEDFKKLEEIKSTSINPDNGKYMLGEIDICYKVAKRQSKEYKHSLKREMAYLYLHGLLHLFGYDHINENDKKEMRIIEEKILNKLNISRGNNK